MDIATTWWFSDLIGDEWGPFASKNPLLKAHVLRFERETIPLLTIVVSHQVPVLSQVAVA
jgi:hypothetical protein